MRKNYILDTNVLLHDPKAIHQFQDNTVVIPISVIEEIDRFKRDLSELGRNARQVSRMLDELRARGKLSDGIPLDNGGVLRVALAPPEHMPGLPDGGADNDIIRLALDLKRREACPCIVVSKDINLRIKADGLGLDAQDYETDRVDISEMYLGHSMLEIGPEDMQRFHETGMIAYEGESRPPNEYLVLVNTADPLHTALGRLDPEGRNIVALIPTPRELSVVRPRNKEQHFALDALLDERIRLVTIIGKAGTGKTLLAIAAGIYCTVERKWYRRMLVSRPTMPMGRDIGYLPGNVGEKLDPWMQPIYDALDLLSSGGIRVRVQNGKENEDGPAPIGVEPLSFIRGRSIHHQYMVIDEAQNLTPLEVKTIITRVGHGTKVVLTGDIYQIDNPYVDSTSNGLSKAVGSFRSYGLAAHICLSKGVRSELAELAANIL